MDTIDTGQWKKVYMSYDRLMENEQLSYRDIVIIEPQDLSLVITHVDFNWYLYFWVIVSKLMDASEILYFYANNRSRWGCIIVSVFLGWDREPL